MTQSEKQRQMNGFQRLDSLLYNFEMATVHARDHETSEYSPQLMKLIRQFRTKLATDFKKRFLDVE